MVVEPNKSIIKRSYNKVNMPTQCQM